MSNGHADITSDMLLPMAELDYIYAISIHWIDDGDPMDSRISLVIKRRRSRPLDGAIDPLTDDA
jgi:hypothetical protein